MYKKMAETIDHLFLCCYIALDIQVLFSIRDLLGIAKIDAKFIKGSQVVVKDRHEQYGGQAFPKGKKYEKIFRDGEYNMQVDVCLISIVFLMQ
jgi:hypothetical protein